MNRIEGLVDMLLEKEAIIKSYKKLYDDALVTIYDLREEKETLEGLLNGRISAE